MIYFLLLSLCSSITSFNPPGTKHDLSRWQKKKACHYARAINQAAKKNDIDKHLYTALILIESGFRSDAVSHAGACGLTQVVPKWTGGPASRKKKYTCEQLKNPWTSIRVGAQVLSYWIYVYASGDIRVGLCGYNAGFRCKTPITTRKGMKYARKVLLMAEHFRTSEAK
jgi:soluble lytic murein transglycosylase-like protein